LRRCSRGKVPLPFDFALYIVGETLKGLGYAHRRLDDEGKPLGIVHRDVSPSNILLSLEGDVKLCDFGIARATELALSPDGDGSAVDEAIKGKAGYMSPEHARGDAIDARSDLFAVGIVLWELIAGRRMYKADTGKPPLLEQARRAEIPELPPRGFAHEDALRAIVYKALAVDRDARFPTAQAMLRDLEAYMGDARLIASAPRLGEWLVSKFGDDIVTSRRGRERAISALDLGPPVSLEPLPPAPLPLPSVPPFLPVGMSGDVDRAPSSIVGASMDVLTTPSQLPVIELSATERLNPPSRSKWILLTAAVGVAAVVVLALIIMRLV
jgi:serine/threonine-protein kinase